MRLNNKLLPVVIGALIFSTTACATNKTGTLEEKSEMYDLIIHGYDWGPGADKIILHLNEEVSAGKLKTKDFQVTTRTLGYNWTAFPPKLDTVAGYREVTEVYPCDENGNKIDGKSSLAALELTVHPEDPFSNPFIFGSTMMNQWNKVYENVIRNEKLGIDIDKLNKKICPEADQFEIGESKTDNITLHYAGWKPSNAADKTPLIIWLHGMGEGGNDPYIALLGNKVVNLISEDVQKHFENGAYVLAPQVNGFWLQATDNKDKMKGWAAEPDTPSVSIYTKALFNLIDNYAKANPEIDRDRIYVGGCSNGGYMTMNMLIEYPDYFAAAYPVCEAYPDSKITDEKLNKLVNQHIWFTQAKNDTTVNPPDFTVKTFKRLQDAGAKDVHFTFKDRVTDQTGNFKKDGKPYDYNGHWSWIYTLNNECEENGLTIFEWLSNQKK